MFPIDILQKLYDSEINFLISTFWDGGFTAKLGDEMNGFKDEYDFETINEAIIWLAQTACNHYPGSKFAKEYLQ